MKNRPEPALDYVLDEIVKQWDAGVLTSDDAVELMIEAHCRWAARFLSSEECAQLRLFLRIMFDTDPNLLEFAGRQPSRRDWLS